MASTFTRWRPAKPTLLKRVSAAAAFWLVAIGAAQADMCVSCRGPDATYTCAIDGQNIRSDDGAMRLYCITALARMHQHASCNVMREQPASCSGTRQVLAAPQGVLPPAAVLKKPVLTPPDTPTEPSDDILAKPAPRPGAGQPKTVSDMFKSENGAVAPSPPPAQPAKQPVEQGSAPSGGVLDDASAAVGSAAKKTWDCVSSFFGKC